jgi:tRNA pseudouridine55 synthase
MWDQRGSVRERSKLLVTCMDGFLNLNKPAGFTSHDCVARVRRILKTKKVGHGGTLDPLATGVLPIAIGKATRLLPYLPTAKAYRAVIRLGVSTTTDDLEGEILASPGAPDLLLPAIAQALPSFIGEITQIPPIYSAIQVNGQRLYQLARAGETVVVPARIVSVQSIDIRHWQPGEFPELTVDIACGGGTYIRSIARDLGVAVGTVATLANLIRTKSCNLELAQSISLTDLEQATDFQPTAPLIALAHLPQVNLSNVELVDWFQGRAILGSSPLPLPPAVPICVTAEFAIVVGIGIINEQQQLWPKVVLANSEIMGSQ